jgi:hypothetical protein
LRLLFPKSPSSKNKTPDCNFKKQAGVCIKGGGLFDKTTPAFLYSKKCSEKKYRIYCLNCDFKNDYFDLYD